MLKRRLVDNQNIYKIDDDTVFLAHADGTTDDALGGSGLSGTVGYSKGKFNLSFDLNSSRYLKVPDNIWKTQLGGKSWTIDFWLYNRMTSFSDSFTFCSSWGDDKNNTSPNSYTIFIGTINDSNAASGAGVGITTFSYNAGTKLINTYVGTNIWHHVAVSYDKSENKMYFFINGILQGSANCYLSGHSSSLYLNYKGDDGHKGNCKIDEFRLSKVCRWKSDFTPPDKPYK